MNIQFDWIDVIEDFKVKIGLRTIDQLRECELLKAKIQRINRNLSLIDKNDIDKMLDLEDESGNVMRELAEKTIKYTVKDWTGLTLNDKPYKCVLENDILNEESFSFIAQNESLLLHLYFTIEKHLASIKKKLSLSQDLEMKTELKESSENSQ